MPFLVCRRLPGRMSASNGEVAVRDAKDAAVAVITMTHGSWMRAFRSCPHYAGDQVKPPRPGAAASSLLSLFRLRKQLRMRPLTNHGQVLLGKARPASCQPPRWVAARERVETLMTPI